MTRLVLIAHAETAATRRIAFAADEALTRDGHEAASLAALRADVASCSPAPAARETAAAMGLVAAPDPALRDLDVGRWRGLPFAEVAAAEPVAADAFFRDPAYAGHGGESIEALVGRVGDWIDGLHAGRGRIVGVTHAAVVRAAVLAALGAPAVAFFRIDVKPLGRVTLGSDGRRWALRAEPSRRG